MGHGNEFFPSSGAYLQFVDVMNTLYPETKTYIATVEGFPTLETVIRQMKKDKITKVLLKPLMTVAGDHTQNDMAGDEPDSMKSILVKNGFQVTTVIEGLGEQDGFADVFVDHLAETANDNGIDVTIGHEGTTSPYTLPACHHPGNSHRDSRQEWDF